MLKHIAPALGLMMMVFSTNAVADETKMQDLGPAVGTQIPHALNVPDQDGTLQSFKKLTGKKGAVLVFFRSAKWCPYCQMQLIDLEQHAQKQAAEMGYSLIGISYDSPADLKKFTNKWSLSFPLLSDQGSVIIDAFGVRNDRDYKPGSFAWGVPFPILIVTDAEGVIKTKLFKQQASDRPEPEVLLEALGKM